MRRLRRFCFPVGGAPKRNIQKLALADPMEREPVHFQALPQLGQR